MSSFPYPTTLDRQWLLCLTRRTPKTGRPAGRKDRILVLENYPYAFASGSIPEASNSRLKYILMCIIIIMRIMTKLKTLKIITFNQRKSSKNLNAMVHTWMILLCNFWWDTKNSITRQTILYIDNILKTFVQSL